MAMWPGRGRTDTVTCLACGRRVERSEAREYDKYGDRWERANKTFEHLCTECHDECCHYPRDDLEALLVDLESECSDRSAVLTAYLAAVEERSGRLEER